MTNWFDQAFGKLYPILYAHRDESSARKEADFADSVMQLKRGSIALDVGCGTGRHIRALKASGLSMVGLDRSGALLQIAKSKDEVPLARGDMRRLPFSDASFDGVFSFFTSFGYFSSEMDDARVLNEVHRVLKPKGRYFLDYLHAPSVKSTLLAESTKEIDGYHMRERRRIDGDRVKKQVTITGPDLEEPLEYEESVRLISPENLMVMLRATGFCVLGSWGSLDGKNLHDGNRCVLMGEKVP